MFSFLKDHPFAVEAHFDWSAVFTFAVPQEQLRSMVPGCLALDTFAGKWGFIAIALVQTSGLRPIGFPAFMGNRFFLIGYRIFVRYTNPAGKTRRGLYILKSETDRRKMEWLGNIFTRYKYEVTDISCRHNDGTTTVNSAQSGLLMTFEEGNETTALPPQSPFANWKDARKFAGPMPFTFTAIEDTGAMLIVEGVRENWIPQPLKVVQCHSRILAEPQLKGAVLANAFIIRDVPYRWKKGIKEQLP